MSSSSRFNSQSGSQPNRNYGSRKPTSSSPSHSSQPSSACDGEDTKFRPSAGGGGWGRPRGSSHLPSQSGGGGGWRRQQGFSLPKDESEAVVTRPNFAAALLIALFVLPNMTAPIADEFTANYIASHAPPGAYTDKDIQDAVDYFIRKRRESSNFYTRGRSDRQNYPPENKVYVGNLPPSCTKPQLNELFRRFGQVININIIHQKQCAFVTFSNPEDAAKALSQANGYVFFEADKSYEIRVDFIRENTAFKAGGGEAADVADSPPAAGGGRETPQFSEQQAQQKQESPPSPEESYTSLYILYRFNKMYDVPAEIAVKYVNQFFEEKPKPLFGSKLKDVINRTVLQIHDNIFNSPENNRQPIPEKDDSSGQLDKPVHIKFYEDLFDALIKYPRITAEIAKRFVSIYSKLTYKDLKFHWIKKLDFSDTTNASKQFATVKYLYDVQHQLHAHYTFFRWLNPYHLIGEDLSISMDTISRVSKEFEESAKSALAAKGKQDDGIVPNAYMIVLPPDVLFQKFIDEIYTSLVSDTLYQAQANVVSLNGNARIAPGDVCIIMPRQILHQTDLQKSLNPRRHNDNVPNWFEDKRYSTTFNAKNMAVAMNSFCIIMERWGAKPLVIRRPKDFVSAHFEEQSSVEEASKSSNSWGAATGH
jgi:RNA recognition motif-containing protein